MTMKHIWALTRATDLHLNVHQLVTSSNNSTQKFHTFPTNFQPGHLNKDTWNVTVPDSLSLDSLSTTTEKWQNVTFLIGYNSRTIKDDVYCRPLFDRYLFELFKNAKINS